MSKNLVPNYQHFSLWPIMNGQKNTILKGFLDDYLDSSVAKINDKAFQPKINIEEMTDYYLVTAEVPGLAENELSISCEKDSLTISGQKTEDFNCSENGVIFQGRSYGKFSQIIPLNFSVKEEQIEATLDKGVLKIVLPKLKESEGKNRKIAIKTIN